MKYSVFRTSSFKKSFKQLSSQDKELVLGVIDQLANGIELDPKYKNHKLIGNYKNCLECHIKPDLLLIYRINDCELELALVQVGSHSKLFG